MVLSIDLRNAPPEASSIDLLRGGLFNVTDESYGWWSDVRGLSPTSTIKDAYTQPGRNGSVSVAAAELNVTRPAISKQVALLERDLACQLLHRDGNRIGQRMRTQLHVDRVRQLVGEQRQRQPEQWRGR